MWPGDPYSVSANRLRVSLSKLRSTCPDLVVEDAQGLSLNGSLTSVDVCDVRKAISDLENEVSPIAELTAIEALADQLALLLLPEADDEDLAGAKADWSEEAFSVLKRGFELAWDQGRMDSVRALARAALTHSAYDPEAWGFLLRSSEEPGAAESALQLLAATTRRSKEAQVVLDPAIQEEAKRLKRRSSERSSRLLPPEQEFASLVITETLSAQPDLLLPILASPQLLPLAASRPSDADRLLSQVLHASSERGALWERCAARTVGLRAWMDDIPGVLELAPEILRESEEPLFRRAAWNALAVAHSLARRWPEAMDAIHEAGVLAEVMEDPIEKLSTEGNRASFLWLQGRFDEADRLYEKVIADLEKLDSPRSRLEEAVALGNRAFIPVFRGHFDEGRQRIEGALEFRRQRQLDIPSLLLIPCLAALKIRDGENEEAPRLLRSGLSGCFSGHSPRFKQSGLEFGAAALAFLGRTASAVSVWDWTKAWRTASEFPLADAEQLFQEKVLEGSDTSKGLRLPPELSPDQVAAWVVREVKLASRG
jgi:tetratricopeptide (TPR) repeat protein